MTVSRQTEDKRRTRVRWTAALLGLLAVGFYVGFIIMQYIRS